MSFEDEKLNFYTIENFWEVQSLKANNRWTNMTFLEFEIQEIRKFLGNSSLERILDLGSGTGALSKRLVNQTCTLDAVDYQENYKECFEGDERFTFFKSDLKFFKSHKLYDLILLFGVLTHLDIQTEELVLNSINEMLSKSGVAIIKLQCADSESFIFNGFSTELNIDYSGRYPSREEQKKRLSKYFSSIVEVAYPPSMKVHENTSHVMFFCKRNEVINVK
jgi:2-polyprenyl-3-methyl-5-hydroxy-6-metoxy-1,4-benzoquinol methylase